MIVVSGDVPDLGADTRDGARAFVSLCPHPNQVDLKDLSRQAGTLATHQLEPWGRAADLRSM